MRSVRFANTALSGNVMEERRRCRTVRQLEMMLDFLEHHQELSLGRVRAKTARAVAARLWRECAMSLNAEGSARTSKEQSKVWHDLKCRVRGKLLSINGSQRATEGRPSNAPTLLPLEEANILGRDVGPLPNVRQDQFALNDIEGDVVGDVLVVADNEAGNISPPIVLNINEAEVQPPAAVSPVPSLQGQAPSPQSDQRANIDSRAVRERRRTVRAPRQATAHAPAQCSRNHLEEARGVIHRIEELRAETALKNAETQLVIIIRTVYPGCEPTLVCGVPGSASGTQLVIAQNQRTMADSFKLIAESIDRLSQKYCQQQKKAPESTPSN